MNKILQSTSRGQITLPKKWRDRFKTDYYIAELKNKSLIIKPLKEQKNLEEDLDEAWEEYKEGKYTSAEDLKKKYGL